MNSGVDTPLACDQETHSNAGSRYTSAHSLNLEDGVSLGDMSTFSHLTADLISAPGNALPLLSDPGGCSKVLMQADMCNFVARGKTCGVDMQGNFYESTYTKN